MKKLMLAMVIVLAFSSAALAVSYGTGTVTLSGQNTWKDGKLQTSTALQNTTLTLSQTDDKNNWKGNAEFNINSSGANYQPATGTGAYAFTLNDVYFQATKQPFTFEVWNWGEDGQGVDYKTPLEWVFANDAPTSNWASRVTTDIAGQNYVLQVKNSSTTPQYYFFTKRALNEGTTVGAAYLTTFNQNNTLDGWVTSDLGPVVVTGEVAVGNAANEKKYAFGAKAAFDSKINLYGYVNNIADKKYAEVVAYDLYRATYTAELAGKKQTIDLKARKSNDQAIADIFNVDNDFFDINVAGDNDWLKDKGWSLGANLMLQEDLVLTGGAAHDKNVITLYAQVAPMANANVLAKVVKTDVENVVNAKEESSLITELRGYYKVNDKVAVHPRLFINNYETADDTIKLGSYVSYGLNKGMLMGGVFAESVAEVGHTYLEAGYEIAF